MYSTVKAIADKIDSSKIDGVSKYRRSKVSNFLRELRACIGIAMNKT